MKRIHLLQIKGLCIIFAAQNEMVLDMSQDDTFQARGGGSILNVPYQHIYDSIQNGWTVDEVLQNESCHDEAYDNDTEDFGTVADV